MRPDNMIRGHLRGHRNSIPTLMTEAQRNDCVAKQLPWMYEVDAFKQYKYACCLICGETKTNRSIGGTIASFMKDHNLGPCRKRFEDVRPLYGFVEGMAAAEVPIAIQLMTRPTSDKMEQCYRVFNFTGEEASLPINDQLDLMCKKHRAAVAAANKQEQPQQPKRVVVSEDIQRQAEADHNRFMEERRLERELEQRKFEQMYTPPPLPFTNVMEMVVEPDAPPGVPEFPTSIAPPLVISLAQDDPLRSKSMNQLRVIAAERGIAGAETMRKQQLLDAFAALAAAAAAAAAESVETVDAADAADTADAVEIAEPAAAAEAAVADDDSHTNEPLSVAEVVEPAEAFVWPSVLYEVRSVTFADPIDGNQGYSVRGACLTLCDATISTTEYAMYKHERRREPIQVFYEQRPEWLPGRGRYYRFPFSSTTRCIGRSVELNIGSQLRDEDELRSEMAEQTGASYVVTEGDE